MKGPRDDECRATYGRAIVALCKKMNEDETVDEVYVALAAILAAMILDLDLSDTLLPQAETIGVFLTQKPENN